MSAGLIRIRVLINTSAKSPFFSKLNVITSHVQCSKLLADTIFFHCVYIFVLKFRRRSMPSYYVLQTDSSTAPSLSNISGFSRGAHA